MTTIVDDLEILRRAVTAAGGKIYADGFWPDGQQVFVDALLKRDSGEFLATCELTKGKLQVWSDYSTIDDIQEEKRKLARILRILINNNDTSKIK